MAKKKKMPRADHYEDKPKKNGSSEDIINVSVNKVPETAIKSKEKKEEEKPMRKKKKN